MLFELDSPRRAGSIGHGAPSVLIGSWLPSRDVVAPRLVCLLHRADARYALWWPLGLRLELGGELQAPAARIADSTPVAREERFGTVRVCGLPVRVHPRGEDQYCHWQMLSGQMLLE